MIRLEFPESLLILNTVCGHSNAAFEESKLLLSGKYVGLMVQHAVTLRAVYCVCLLSPCVSYALEYLFEKMLTLLSVLRKC